jgi:putative toxin-antitoxin system antitoxin component (TIGR02293 family)
VEIGKRVSRAYSNQVLAPGQSFERLHTLKSVRAHALDTFGSAEKAEHWMSRPNPLLQGKTPQQVAESDPSSVEAALVRIDYGVYV